MMLVTGVLTILFFVVLQVFVRTGRPHWCMKIAVFYLLIHAIASVCTYKEWAPDYFNQFPKDVMQFQTLLNFIFLCAIPL